MLYQLPNGNWIDPAIVVAVKIFPATSPSDPMARWTGVLPARVSIITESGAIDSVCFESNDDAETFRDELAARTNGCQQAAARTTEGETIHLARPENAAIPLCRTQPLCEATMTQNFTRVTCPACITLIEGGK